MKNYPLWKIFIVFLLLSLGVIFAVPSILYKEDTGNWYLDNRLNLGLDLQGGSYLLLEVQTDVLIKEEFENFSETIRIISRENRIKINNIELLDDELKIRFETSDKLDEIRSSFLQKYRSVKFNLNNNIATITVDVLYKKNIQDSAIKQSLEIVRKRIDESGTKEPLIQRSGRQRILLQLPGVKDPERIKNLLGKTAKLNFHMVDDDDSKSLSLNLAPFGKMIVADINNEEIKYLLEKKSKVGGENLIDAYASFDQTQGHAVSFRFDTTGAQKFGKATSENVGKRFAVVLDGVVITAPVINSAITGGSGIITGNFSSQEATDLAVLLRAGALPAPLQIVEERSVGPGLGADSIAAGKIASIIGMILVCIFMILIYGSFGVIANISLIANLFIIVALLGTIGATLTLPGIAGIVLTIGMAVDANVLIFERIKEENLKNKKVYETVKKGFDRALSTILDANITTLIASLLLFVFGSGPIKGFSITLSLGVIASMFTALMLTNLLVHFYLSFTSKKEINL
ncbi:MAG: protein translocase subunit SecD [Pelagibacteraceae bacterium]|nr:protein translocase subunit SecD [Pelagibacteraceae bacterium]MBT3901273.1 protein translocase subunit SecD [Pelagibacteraceae bacterium]MBT4644953.1 protein translocase subunit SecD [Pelagibacteraceae bacterium]